MSSAAIKLLHADADGFTRLFGQALYDEYAALFGLEQGPVSLSSIVISPDGVAWTFTFSRTVTSDGTGFSGEGVAAGAVALTYASGSGTTALVFTGDTEVPAGDTATADYDAGVGNVADTDANELASFTAETVTNQSEFEPAVAPTLLYAFAIPDDQLILKFDRAITGNTGLTYTAAGGDPILSNPTVGANATVLKFDLSRLPDGEEVGTLAASGSDIASSGGAGLADFSGVPVIRLYKWEDGKRMPNPAQNAAKVSAQAGDWDDTLTWGGDVPTATDDVILLHEVTVDSTDAVAKGILIATGGKLTFDATVNTKLVYETILLVGTGALQAGTTAARIDAAVTCELVKRDAALPHQNIDPWQVSHGIIGLETSSIQLHGAVMTTDALDLVLAVEPEEGHTSLEMANAPSGWAAGHKLILPPTTGMRGGAFADQVDDEVLEIQSVSGTTVNLTSALVRDHFGARNSDGSIRFMPHVMNLSRNLILRNENSSPAVRFHTMVSDQCDFDISYCRFDKGGRTTDTVLQGNETTVDADGFPLTYGTNNRGRYAVHLHHWRGPENALDTGWQAEIVGIAIDGGLKWGLTLHGASYVRLHGNNIYDVQYSGIQFEDGNEAYNELRENVVMKFVGSSSLSAVCNGYTILELGYNEFYDNVAAYGHTSDYLPHGFHVDGPRRSRVINVTGPGGLVGDPTATNGPYRYPLFRGADLHGTEGVDYELKNRGSTTWVHDGFRCYAGSKAHSYDHYSHPDGVTFTRLESWALTDEESFIYGGQGNHVYANTVVRKFSGYGFEQQSWGADPNNPTADSGTTTLTNPDIFSGEPSAVGLRHWRGSTVDKRLVVNGGTIGAPLPVAVVFCTSGGVAPGAIEDTSQTTWLHGCTLTPTSGAVEIELSGLGMTGGVTTSTVIPMVRHQVLVTNRNGNVGENYQLFWDEQDPAGDAPCVSEIEALHGTGFTAHGASVCGETNAERFAAEGLCVGGELMPAGASTVAWLTGGKAIEFLRATVAADGTTVTVAASTAITTDGTGWSLDLATGGAVALTYVSGSGTKTLTFTAGSTVDSGDTGSALYDADTGDAELTLAGAPLPDLTFPVTNNSEQGGGSTAEVFGVGTTTFAVGTTEFAVGA